MKLSIIRQKPLIKALCASMVVAAGAYVPARASIAPTGGAVQPNQQEPGASGSSKSTSDKRTAVTPPRKSAAKVGSPSTLQAINVMGTIGSLLRETVTKQANIGVVDSISAESAGSFPDSTIAGSLQRVPGVSVDRNADGEPNQISIRGLGPQFVSVLLNGERVASPTFERSFNLDTLPVGLLQQAVVYKTSQAHLPAGGIGGTVDIVTWQPLEFNGFHATVSAAGAQASLPGSGTEKTKPQVSAMIGDTLDNKKFGWLLALGYEQRDVQYTGVDAEGGWRPANLTATTPPQTAFLTEGIESNYAFQTRTRKSADLSLEAQPTTRLHLDANFLMTRYTGNDQTDTNDYFAAFNQITSATTDRNNTVTSFVTNTVPGVQDVFEPAYMPIRELMSMGTIHVSYDIGDGNTLSIYSSSSQASNKVLGIWHGVAGYLTNSEFPLAFHNDSLQGGAFPYYTGGAGTVDIANLRTHDTQLTGTSLSDRLLSNRIVFEHDFLSGIVSSVDGGISSTAETNRTNSVQWPNDAFFFHQFFGSFNVVIPPSAIDAQVVTYPNLGGKYGVNQPKSFISYSPSQLIAFLQSPAAYNQLSPESRATYLKDLANYPNGVPMVPAPGALSRVREIDNSAYGEVNLDGSLFDHDWSMQLGMRYTRTALASSGTGQPLQALDFDAADFDSAVQVFGPVQPIVERSTYDYWLPSLNFKYHILDNVLFRAAYSKTLTRPDLNELGIGSTYSVESLLTETTGNPALQPYLSKNYDLGVGWFIGPASYLSFDLFEKKMSNFITLVTRSVPASEVVPSVSPLLNPALVDPGFLVTEPVNLNNAKIKGYEVTANYQFAELPSWLSGFGVMANFTRVESSASASAAEVAAGTVFAVPGIGNSYNASVYYDKYGIDTRVAWNYRNAYLFSIAGAGGEPVTAAAYGELDFKISYDIGHHWQIFFSADNLTNESVFQYSIYTNRPILGSVFGRRYLAGAKWTL